MGLSAGLSWESLVTHLLLAVPFIGAYAMFAIGISTIYRASRVLNLAHGAMAMVPAYLLWSMTRAGLPVGLGLPLAVLAGSLLGVLVEFVFVRRLRAQGPTAQTVGTVAVTGLLIAVAAKVWGTTPRLAVQVFPVGSIPLGRSGLRFGDIGLFVVGLLMAGATFAFFRFTAYGLALRAAAENRRAAAMMGIDPDLAASAAWAIGGGLAGLSGILLAAVTDLDPYNLSLQVLPAFVAALIGGLESLAGALLGALVAGLIYSLVSLLQEAPLVGTLFRYSGATQLTLALLAMVVMMLRGRRFSATAEGGGLAAAPSGRALHLPRRVAPLAAWTALGGLVAWPFLVPYSVLGDSLNAMELALVAISLVVLTGWVGQISLAQASFVGIAACVTGLLSRQWGIVFPLSLLIAAAASGIAATALGVVALRVRGLYLAVATLIFAWMADQFLFQSPWLGIGGGSSTIDVITIGRPGSLPTLDFSDRRTLYFIALAVVAIVVTLMANLRTARTGRALYALRGSELAATSLGIDVTRYKLVAFALSGVLAGVGGNLLMLDQRTVVPAQFLLTVSLQYLAIVVVGGLGSLRGALAAGALFAALNEVFFRVSALNGWLEVVSALLLAVVLLAYPGGLAAIASAHARRLLDRLAPEPRDSDAALLPLTGATGSPAEAAAPESARVVPLRAYARAAVEGETILHAEGVTVRFGGLTAVDNAHVRVRRGEIVGLIGPNGAGKTTLFNAILGLNEPDTGRIEVFGRDVTAQPPHVRARQGIARTFQVLQLFPELSVFDNVLVATHGANRSSLLSNLVAAPGTVAAEIQARQLARQVLSELGLAGYADRSVQGLPFGVLRMVELARALATGSRLVMLDEPASGLNEVETDRLITVLRRLQADGISILLIEHDVRMVAEVSDHLFVLDQGQLIAEGPAQQVQRDPAVITAYLGDHGGEAAAV